ncbi:MAG: antitoxin MazE [Nitrospirales bacterium]|nr:MAG: antitoxin MazE [Nitrospirales bacterium]
MITKVQKWGNSQGLRVPKRLLEDAEVKMGDEVQVSVHGRKIVIEPLTKIRGKYQLKKLVSMIPKHTKVKEMEWGEPKGKEIW